MEHDIELLWLPLDRVAALTDKSIKTVRRLAEDGNYVVLKRTVPSGKTHTTKSFVMADQELTNLEKAYCRRHRLKPVPMDKELMTVIETKYNSLFIVSYRKLSPTLPPLIPKRQFFGDFLAFWAKRPKHHFCITH